MQTPRIPDIGSSGKGARPVAGRRVQLALLAAAILAGVALGAGMLKLVVLAVVATIVFIVVTRFPETALALAVVLTCTVPVLALGEALSVGPISLHWTDLGFAALVWAGVVAANRLWDDFPPPLFGYSALVLPFAVILLVKVVLALSAGVSLEPIGAILRNWAWYLTIPAVAVVFVASERNELLRRSIHVAALLTSFAIVLGAVSQRAGAFMAENLGARLVEVPGYAGELGRLYLPGRTLIPTALALVVAPLVWEATKGRSRGQIAMAVTYVAGIIATLGRGMWLAVVAAFGLVLSIRMNGRIAARVAAMIVFALGAFFLAALLIGKTPEMPDGLVGVVTSRAEELVERDVNAEIRFTEMTEVSRQTEGHEIIGVPLGQHLGILQYLDDGTTAYTVHNSYFAVYGRFGAIGLIAFLLPLLWGIVIGVRLVANESGYRLAWSLAGLIGLLRVMLVSWTQHEVTEFGGIFVFVLSAGILLGLAATRERTA